MLGAEPAVVRLGGRYLALVFAAAPMRIVGLVGVYAGIVLSYACWALIAAAGFVWGDWADTAADMMAERAESEGESEGGLDADTDPEPADSTPQD